MSGIVCLTNVRILPALPSARVEEGQHARNEEENAIHNPKGKGSLKHRTLLVATKMPSIPTDGYVGKIDLVGIASCDRSTVFVGYAAQLVDACDQGADEAEVDEGDEEGVVLGAAVGEEGADCPGRCEHGDDEEDEDIVGC